VGSQPSSVVAVDLNNDQNLDLVVANAGSASLTILLGTGAGVFPPDLTFTVPVLPGPKNLRGGFFNHAPIMEFSEVAFLSFPLNTPLATANIIAERADIDGSGEVNGKDLALWASGFGLSRGDPGYAAAEDADINLDGKIDGLDLVFLTSQFGVVVPPP